MHFRRSGLSGLLALLSAAVAACSRPEPHAPPPATVSAPPPAAAPALSVPPPPLGRAELLQAVAAAADAYAAGRPTPPDVREIAGRRLRLRLPFGCAGAPAAETRLGYEWEAKTGELKLSAAPQVWSDNAELRARLRDEDIEALEGFWLRRPWLRSETCPVSAADRSAAPSSAAEQAPKGASRGRSPTAPAEVGAPAEVFAPAPSPESLGLVTVFGREGSRLHKRAARPYEIKLKGEEAPGPEGYRLVLEGRVGGDEDHPSIACLAREPNQRPTCYVRAVFDRVAFETPAGRKLAEWPQ